MKEDKLDAKNWNLLKLQRYQGQNHDALVRLGTPTWESAKYQGTLYDHGTPLDEFLTVYASQYDAVEYRASFLDVPSERTMEKLRLQVEEVNKNFKFCPMIPRRISHEFELGENPFDLKEFLQSVTRLGAHLGPCVLRLPETFSPLMVQKLPKFLKLWPQDKELVLNFTHLDWIKKVEALRSVQKTIQGTAISILIEDRMEHVIDVEKLLCGHHLVVRFYGRPGLNQDDQRLAHWVYRLGEYRGYGIRDSYFFLYEQEEMCLSLLRKMANSMGGNVRVPARFDQVEKQISFKF